VVTPDAPPLVCAFGTPWRDHTPMTLPLFACPACRDETVRMRAVFRAGVAAGTHDATGHTPAERQARRKDPL